MELIHLVMIWLMDVIIGDSDEERYAEIMLGREEKSCHSLIKSKLPKASFVRVTVHNEGCSMIRTPRTLSLAPEVLRGWLVVLLV